MERGGLMDVTLIPKISADAHVDEPHDLWFERLPETLRDQAPRRITPTGEGTWTLVVNGESIGWGGVGGAEAAALEAERSQNVRPEVRLDAMRIDGVRAETVFPTIGLYVWNIENPETGEAACRIYNDWIRERLGGQPRIRLNAMIPTWNVEMAIAEIERVADDASFGGLLVPLVGTPSWNMPEWEPLWSAIAETGKPAVMHQGTGHDMLFYRGWGSPTANVLATQSMASRTTGLLACSGVLERHPDLDVVLVEVNGGWLAWTMQVLDEYYQAHKGWSKPKLAELPSHYIKRQIHATFQSDYVAIHNVPLTGTDCLLWGNDYPHPEGIHPHSNKVLAELLSGVSDEVALAVTCTNAMKVFGFSEEVTRSLP
jgi:predicted TIM-barrel fold metal-dependent hydrolase